MSASLVGSEMCIRDRSCTAHWSDFPNCPERTSPTRPLAEARALRSRRTVSYTHLTLPTICSV
eukprot:6350595-Alexandrium_andersonii.AAC.1